MTQTNDAFYEDYVKRGTETFKEDRLERILAAIPPDCRNFLDVGCGTGRNLLYVRPHFPNAHFAGTDIAHDGVAAIRALGFEGVQCDASVAIPYDDSAFDVILCGEVIEHVVDTDRLAAELHRVLAPGGKLIVTTPNLAYAVNRLLLLFGIQPLFTETSYRRNMGRIFRVLGQDKPTQGHLKIFTRRALEELLRSQGFVIERVHGYRTIQTGIAAAIDGLLAKVPALAAGLIVEARPSKR